MLKDSSGVFWGLAPLAPQKPGGDSYHLDFILCLQLCALDPVLCRSCSGPGREPKVRQDQGQNGAEF